MKPWLYTSLLINVLGISLALFAVHRLGGWKYTWLKLQRQTAGQYQHRVQHFENLDEKPGAIIFLGDSQTEQAEWHEFFGDHPIVLNRGISGDFAQGVLDRLPEVLRHKPAKIFLLIGVNDLVFGNSLQDIEAVYGQIVAKIRTTSPQTELYLQSLLPVNNHLRKTGANNARIAALNQRIIAIAHAYALPFVDIGTPMKDAEGNLSERFSEDGLHLNGLGYQVWKNEIKQFIP
ncbi:MAG TPA: GDSL-type esterase/lipase family protein [Saprospiraceae bacterium]|nr:GDSL-type esterase/lipase family protein [Saprospiraceae bacterium]